MRHGVALTSGPATNSTALFAARCIDVSALAEISNDASAFCAYCFLGINQSDGIRLLNFDFSTRINGMDIKVRYSHACTILSCIHHSSNYPRVTKHSSIPFLNSSTQLLLNKYQTFEDHNVSCLAVLSMRHTAASGSAINASPKSAT